MHLRNPYLHPPNLTLLAEKYPALLPLLTDGGRGPLDFQNPAALRILTQALLHVDFGLSIELPEDRLCPPVPNRLDYVLWIQDIVSAKFTSSTRVAHHVHGLDIGTGASAIYPLLGCSLDPTWSFHASDIDDVSLEYAAHNIKANNLQERVTLVRSEAEGMILGAIAVSGLEFDFTMCNPPFYSSAQEIIECADGKEIGPSGACTGSTSEMITEGGEVEFVSRMIEESISISLLGASTQFQSPTLSLQPRSKGRCRWYTSMLGKLSSVGKIVEVLKGAGIDNYALTEFIQGYTRRWGIAWSLEGNRLPDSLARATTLSSSLHRFLPARNTIIQPLPFVFILEDNELLALISSIEGAAITEAEGEKSWIIQLQKGDTWSRAARRGRNRDLGAATMGPSQTVTPQQKSMCALSISIYRTDEEREEDVEERKEQAAAGGNLIFQWLHGSGGERKMYESFCSHLSRRVLAASQSSASSG